MFTAAPVHSFYDNWRTRGWSDLGAVALITAFVVAVYFSRLGTQPIVGEESRWGTAAREMISTGDWVVPRQQAHPFPERPPMTIWVMAVTGVIRGEVDALAIRIPSVLAVWLTSLVIYAYARSLISPQTGLVAAIVYASFGQVLQIGRMGESESLFALFVSASLLLWHLGYVRGWPALATWSVGFACAALAALVKGPQAPVYFGAITAVYLILRRDRQFALRWQFLVGVLVFGLIVGAWQIPFYLATDWQSMMATWSGLAADRIHLGGVFKHVFSYPLETFACLLPWSPLLVALVKRETRELLVERNAVASFLYTAILVAYPTVWLATGARGRYFMPLYPVVAVLIGFLVVRMSQAAAGRYPRRAWHQFLLLSSVMAVGVGSAMMVLGTVRHQALGELRQPTWYAIAIAIGAVGTILILRRCYHSPSAMTPVAAVLAVATLAGAAYTGAVITANTTHWNDPTIAIADLKTFIPADATLVSFTPIDHRFAYYYNDEIPEFRWPTSTCSLQRGVEYFCFMRHEIDTAERRDASRGRTIATSPGTLPFAWEEIKSICVERSPSEQTAVVLGRVIRPLRAEISDVSRPQVRTAMRSKNAE